jgi:hypothetical protein
MNLLRLLSMVASFGIAYALMSVGTRVPLKRQRAGNAPQLRTEIEAQVCFATALTYVSVLGKGGWTTHWLRLQGPKRLIVGTDAFIVSAPRALREYAFRGCECSIAFSQAPSRFVNRDCIVITGPSRCGSAPRQARGRQVKLAISRDNLLEVWQALAGTGALTSAT